mmetsp:Transcript_63207/g.151028  ORF Transcript_63207/g.151028 Transcript_63207/m.151028 type:complete len:236 (-) Transcript_63207:289-996(-)
MGCGQIPIRVEKSAQSFGGQFDVVITHANHLHQDPHAVLAKSFARQLWGTQDSEQLPEIRLRQHPRQQWLWLLQMQRAQIRRLQLLQGADHLHLPVAAQEHCVGRLEAAPQLRQLRPKVQLQVEGPEPAAALEIHRVLQRKDVALDALAGRLASGDFELGLAGVLGGTLQALVTHVVLAVLGASPERGHGTDAGAAHVAGPLVLEEFRRLPPPSDGVAIWALQRLQRCGWNSCWA